MVLNRQSSRLYSLLLVIIDFLCINLAFSIAWLLRFQIKIIPLKQYQPFDVYLISVSLASFFWILIFAYRGLYSYNPRVSVKNQGTQLLGATIIAAFVTMALSFMYRQFAYSRFVFIIGTLLAFLIIFAARIIFTQIVLHLLKKGIGVAKTVILGSGEAAESLAKIIAYDQYTKVGFLGLFKFKRDGEINPKLKEALVNEGAKRVIVAGIEPSEEDMRELLYECRKEGASVEFLPPFDELLQGRVERTRLGGYNLLLFKDIALEEWQRIVKRSADILLSIILLMVLSPFLLIIALLIKLTSKGPTFYKQIRIGRNGRKFKMIKFRSMYRDADKRVDELLKKYNVSNLKLIKLKKDPRITPVGRFLRRFSLDELPQLINVLKGEMSLVGPRPPLPREVELYHNWELKRVDVTPGMTGLWQVSGRSDVPFEKMVEYDLEYIKNWSLWLDLKILLKTPLVVLTGKGAY